VILQSFLSFVSVSGLPARLLRSVRAVMGTWDDHDYGENNAGVEFKHKRTTQVRVVLFIQRCKSRESDRNVFGWEITHEAVPPRPPISLYTIVARTGGSTYA
jgi:hypothetical protein